MRQRDRPWLAGAAAGLARSWFSSHLQGQATISGDHPQTALCPPACPSGDGGALTGAPADPAVGSVVPAVAVPSGVLAAARTRPALGRFAAPPGGRCGVGACRERDKGAVRLEKQPPSLRAARPGCQQQGDNGCGHCSRTSRAPGTAAGGFCTTKPAHSAQEIPKDTKSPAGKQCLRYPSAP